jgi:hypothetical protein
VPNQRIAALSPEASFLANVLTGALKGLICRLARTDRFLRRGLSLRVINLGVNHHAYVDLIITVNIGSGGSLV